MNRVNNLALILLTFFALVSCKKEYSLETDGSIVEPPPLYTDCKLQKLVESLPPDNKGEYAYITTFDAAHMVSQIDFVDSTANAVNNSFPVSYPPGRVQLDADQYFVVDADSNVIEFHGHEIQTDPTSEMITVKYTYGGSGQIISREEEYDSLPGVVTFRVDYVYTGTNLTQAEARLFDGVNFSKIGEVNYEYDETVTIKPFISLYALAPELIYFQTAIKYGPHATNPLKKTVAQILAPGTDNVLTYVTEYLNYNIDASRYVKSFDVSGDDFDLAGLYSGKRYLLEYHCY